MTRDDIIRMADQSEIDPYDMCEDHRIGVHRLMAFASLVAAAEREACAKMCDELLMATECATAIRARGQDALSKLNKAAENNGEEL